MKASMRKTTYREIRSSLGRYFAIFAIVALGVGFFVGLTVTTPAMVRTGGAYLNGHELYDLRLVSTLGFDRDAVERFRQDGRLQAAEGAVSADFLALDGQGESRVLTAQTLLEVQNQLELTAGRMPEAADEVVADAGLFLESDLGSTIRVSQDNPEETTELFSRREYTIVGLANSSYYVNYERGSTSLGNGRIAGFVYLLPAGFDTDYDTEIFLRLRQDYELYSAEYEEAEEALKDWVEPLTRQAAQERYDRLVAEGEAKIAEAEEELAGQTADAKAELADAEAELARGEKELSDGEEKLADGRRQLAAARKELEEQKRQLEAQRQQLEAQKQQLEASVSSPAPGDGLTPGESGSEERQAQSQAQAQAQWQAQAQALAQWQAQLADGQRQLSEAESELSLREREISSREAELSEARTALSDGRREYEDGQRTLARETAEAQEKIDDAREELGKLEKPEIYVLGRDTNVGYASYENDSSIVAGIARVFPFFFFLVAALVCMTTMNRMVEEQRTQIGVLKALGYSEASIMGKYLFYAGSAAVAGAVVGFLTGSVLFPSVIWTAYKIMYRMGDYMVLWSVPLAVQSLAVALLCSMGTTCLTCRYELKSAAAELIRPRAPKSGKRIWLEHLPFLWNRLSFLTKVSIRNVFRYRQRFFMMVMGIGGCTALLLTGFGVKDTIADVGALQFGEIQLYDMSATLKNAYEPGDAREDAELSRTLEQDVQDWLAVSEKSVDITGTEGVRTASLVIPRDVRAAPDYVGLHTEEGEPVAWPGVGEAVLNDNLAKRCGIKTGDTIRLSVGDGEELEVRVTALCRNFISNYVYISPETWEEGIGTAPEYRSLYLHTAKGIRDRALAEKLLACDAVSTVSVNADMLNQVENMMGSLDSVVLLIILCAGALAFIVIYNLTNINITERIREIATIKVLGFYPRETSAYVFRENVLLTAIGAAAGLLGGIWLLHFVMARIDIDMISFQVRILPISYIRSVLLTFAFMLVVDVMMYVKLGKINMAESLKSVE